MYQKVHSCFIETKEQENISIDSLILLHLEKFKEEGYPILVLDCWFKKVFPFSIAFSTLKLKHSIN